MAIYRRIYEDARCHEHTVTTPRGVRINLYYQDEDLVIICTQFPDGLHFFRPPVLKGAIKTYQLLRGSAETVVENVQLAIGDLVVLRDCDEALCFHLTDHAMTLTHIFRDVPYRTTLDQYASVHKVLETVQSKDNYTLEHCLRVWELAQFIGLRLGVTPNDMRNLLYAAVFHDVGKIVIPDYILNKPGPLSLEEYEIIKQHVVASGEIVESVEYAEVFRGFIEMHHERLDGSGYPHGLKGDSIPLEARILAVLDSFDAMTTDRVYKKGMDIDDALAELYSMTDKYDELVVDALVGVLETEGDRLYKRSPGHTVDPV